MVNGAQDLANERGGVLLRVVAFRTLGLRDDRIEQFPPVFSKRTSVAPPSKKGGGRRDAGSEFLRVRGKRALYYEIKSEG